MADKQEQKQPIIIKKVKKGGHAAHGGAWKIAYADFVTAMMAFFLLLWLLNAVSQEQLEGISNYFAPVSVAESASGSGGVLGGKTIGSEGALDVAAARATVTLDLPPPKAGEGSEDDEDKGSPDEKKAEEIIKKKEEEQFKAAEDALRNAILDVPSLQELAKSLLIDNTPEGLRIQISDQEGLAMFPSGAATMYRHTRKIMELVVLAIKTMPQKISISGHTDAIKFAAGDGYGNWELSADRANASRRAMQELGIPEERFAKVVGLAANDPLLPDDPNNPTNRRLTIVLLRGTGVQPPRQKTERQVPPQHVASRPEAAGNMPAGQAPGGQ